MSLLSNLLLCFFVLFNSKIAMGAWPDAPKDDSCTASVIITDFQGNFRTEAAAFSWCFERIQWWGIDASDGWRDKFCNIIRYRGDYAYKWRGRFYYKRTDRFSSNYSDDMFDRFHKLYSKRVFQGWRGKLQIQFGERCGY